MEQRKSSCITDPKFILASKNTQLGLYSSCIKINVTDNKVW